jgi:hypothetical protein
MLDIEMSRRDERVLRCATRLYGVMLRTYPSDFQRVYAGEMMLAFRARAREVLRSEGLSGLLPLAVHIAGDWLRSTSKEHSAMGTRLLLIRWIAALPAAMLGSYVVMRLVGVVFGVAVVTHHFSWVGVLSGAGVFLMSVTFVAVAIVVAPARKPEVARVAASVVSVLGMTALGAGVFVAAVVPAWLGVCTLAGGLGVYFLWRLRCAPAAQA